MTANAIILLNARTLPNVKESRRRFTQKVMKDHQESAPPATESIVMENRIHKSTDSSQKAYRVKNVIKTRTIRGLLMAIKNEVPNICQGPEPFEFRDFDKW